MKKLILGLGLVIVLAGCSNNPGPNPYSTAVPDNQSTATSSTTVVAVPDMCQWLTAAKATEITGLGQMRAVDGETSNDFSPDGVLWTSDCGWWSQLASPDNRAGSAEALCVYVLDAVATFGQVERQDQNSELRDQPAADVIVKPVTGLGSQAFLATGISGLPKYGAEVVFLEGSTVWCDLYSTSDIRTGDAQGVSLLALAHQVAQAIHP